jgi:hypothetical protein
MKIETRLPGTTTLPIRRSGGGYAAEGPGFYIWDEDPREVFRVARELERGNFAARPTTRLLVIRPAPEDGTDGTAG